MGFEGRLVSHCMRSMASTILNEHDWDPELIEVALALLETIKPYSGHREFVFPADRDPRTHCNSQTARQPDSQYGTEADGFRGAPRESWNALNGEHHPQRAGLGS